ncbi:uncharacterized protein LOC131958037 [Physella acuta]|uniref:uncharacterized protein LOC131958037 n=1 Tax=Physella acuta TaxID=109671 RepID=UPI0027DD925A|nr:uncharacterized protein LOC131958037 [Physella acuta]
MLTCVLSAVAFLGAVVTGIHFQASPNIVVVGVTRYLELKCGTTRGEDSSIESLISIIISRTANPQDTTFKELASLTMFTPEVQITDVSEVNLISSGNIDNNGESYIRLVWEFPGADKAGNYKCDVNGVDHIGHPIYFNSAVMISSRHPDVETVAAQIKNLTLLVENVNSYMNLLKDEEILLKVRKWDERIEAAKHSFFTISEAYDGRRYYLSKLNRLQVAEDAEAMCKLFGGYLTEVDSFQEHEFIIQFLTKFASVGYYTILTGGTDEAHENVWINRRNNTPVAYIKWGIHQPDGATTSNCLVLYSPNWYMADYPCSLFENSFSTGYLCEIPDK